MTLRLFLGIAIPEEIASLLKPMQCGLDGASFSPRENFHITLRFIGDLEAKETAELDAQIALIHQKPFKLSLNSVDFFGKEHPNSIHALVKQTPEIMLLAQRCENACRHLGHEPETRNYKPHVTLAYLRKNIALRNVLEWQSRHNRFTSPEFEVNNFYLYSSHTGNGPSHYRIEAEYPLLG